VTSRADEPGGVAERRAARRKADEPPGSRDRPRDADGAEPARLRPPVERPADRHQGQALIVASWVGTGLFALVAIPAAAAPGTFAPFLIVVSLALFLAGTVVFALAYLTAIGRSREVLIGMGGLFFLAGGTAPLRVSRHLIGSFAAQCVVAVATTLVGLFTVPADVTNPVAFGVLVPIYGLGLAGLWSARYGAFAERPPDPSARSRRPPR
jgi:hypothetical protein